MVEISVTKAMTHVQLASAPVTPAAGAASGEGVAGQRQADDHRHRAGDGGGQYLLHRAAAAEADDQARGDGHKAGKHDAELRLRDQRRGKDARGLELGDLLGGALGGHHAGMAVR